MTQVPQVSLSSFHVRADWLVCRKTYTDIVPVTLAEKDCIVIRL